ncbi:MAG: hypothetical protein SH809_15220 [Rhodothermales bacterium]|nr:hypothetical protein [Rhodothermales bacterium]
MSGSIGTYEDITRGKRSAADWLEAQLRQAQNSKRSAPSPAASPTILQKPFIRKELREAVMLAMRDRA